MHRDTCLEGDIRGQFHNEIAAPAGPYKVKEVIQADKVQSLSWKSELSEMLRVLLQLFKLSPPNKSLQTLDLEGCLVGGVIVASWFNSSDH